MKNLLITISALIIGFFAMIFSLLMAIPLAIAAFITGNRIKKQMEQQLNSQPFRQDAAPGATIEGEYENVSTK
ncbi:hypothetical protein MD535_06935 [Vibrio sp. ZSDZ65]|uniref:Hydroxylamine reductase n=1 Tax=Vibrio qingdaonensis TaxID=2829491 RepID=A0A9X3CM01_9VIBR|nr:hypothetical protein [Vibrio qingdaonensis]MCW8345745.1 hypothetical protein [Vibrio qingdaonensis]